MIAKMDMRMIARPKRSLNPLRQFSLCLDSEQIIFENKQNIKNFLLDNIIEENSHNIWLWPGFDSRLELLRLRLIPIGIQKQTNQIDTSVMAWDWLQGFFSIFFGVFGFFKIFRSNEHLAGALRPRAHLAKSSTYHHSSWR